MAFFNKIKNIFTGDSNTTLNNDTPNKKSAGDKTIEKALLGVKKYYEFKVKLANEITDINPEWEFYDEFTQKNKIIDIKLRVEKLNDNKNSEIENINRERLNINSYESTYNQNLNSINNYKYSLNKEIKENERIRIQTKINTLNENNQSLLNKINQSTNVINQCEQNIASIDNDIIDLQFLIITELAFIPNSYEECKTISQQYNIVNNFISFGIEAVYQYNKGNLHLAKEYVKKYFVSEVNNTDTIHNPIIDGIYAAILMEKGNYTESKEFLEYVIQYYPDSIVLHKMLKQIHINLGEDVEAQLEQSIINLLS